MKHLKSRITVSALALISGITSAYAQQVALEEIVVTARKREENLMTTPLAITAFTSKEIESSGLKDIMDISTHTPGFYTQTQVGGGSGRADRSFQQLTFRGLALANNGGLTAGGLLFVDGAPVIGAQIAGLEGVQSVEVLKGPQSAYFGRSTFAGALSVTTREPSMEFKGKISADVSTYNSTTDSVSLEGPIVKDILAVRISGYHDFRGGQYTNFADQGQKFGEQKTDSISGSFVFKPTDALKIKGYFNYFENNDGPPAQGAIKSADMNCNLGGTLGRYYCGTVPDKLDKKYISGNYTLNSFSAPRLIDNINNNFYVVGKNYLQHPGLTRHALQGDVKIDYDFESGITASSLTAYHSDKSGNLIDLSFRDGRNLPNANAAFIPGAPAFVWWYLTVQNNTHDFSQELRLTSSQKDRLRWTVGGNYFRGFSPGGAVNGFSVFGNLSSSSVTKAIASTPALFGGLYYDLMPSLTLSAEGRYQWDTITNQPITSAGGVALNGTGRIFKQTYGSFSPRVTLDYKFMENSTVYALWSRGYRPGGFNSGLSTIDPAVFAQYFASTGVKLAYDQEKLDNFELGLKARFFDDRAAVRTALYYDKYSGGQIGATVLYYGPGNPNVQLASPIQNIGKVDLKGIEVEGEFQATKEFKIGGTFALNDSKIKAFFCADCLQVYGNTNAIGHRLAISPKYNWSINAEYTNHLAGTYDWYTRVDYTHRGSYFGEYANVSRNSAANIVNLRVGARNEVFSLEAYATNLFQDSSPQIALGTDLFTVASTAEVRYGLATKRKFGLRGKSNF